MFARSMLALVALALTATSAFADPVIYTETFTGSGTFDSQTFTGDLVTITAGGVGVAGSAASGNYTLTTTVTITVVGNDLIGGSLTDTLSDTATGVYVNQSATGATAGFFDNEAVVMATQDQSFYTYYLGQPITVTNAAYYTSGPPSFPPGTFTSFATTNGGATGFELSAVTGVVPMTSPYGISTFTAVPEPSSVAMISIALLLGGVARLRRQRATTV